MLTARSVGSRAQRAALFTSSDSIINGKPPTIKFCPECKINPGEGICKSCLASTKSLTPAKVTKMLSEYVVGQDQVKRALGVSMFLHLQRVKANDWIKYEGKGKPKTNSSKASSSSGLDKNTSDYLEKILRGGISPNITKMIVTSEFVAKLDGKNFPTKVLLKELVDLKSNKERVHEMLVSEAHKPNVPSVMTKLAVHAGKASTEEDRLKLVNECKDKFLEGEFPPTALLAALEEEIGRNDWSPVSSSVRAKRLEVIRTLEPLDADLTFRCRVLWIARPVMHCMESLQLFKELALGGKAGAYLPFEEQKIVIQERDKLESQRGLLPDKFQLCLDCERLLNLCTSRDEDVVAVLNVVGPCLQNSLFVGDAVPTINQAASTIHQTVEDKLDIETQKEEGKPIAPSEEEKESALYSGRIQDLKELQVQRFDKSNVLLMGPTGSGKTLLAKSLASCVKVPLVICDATTLTAAGYVGDDVDSILHKLLEEANWDVSKAESGIVFLDEIDKIAKRSTSGRSRDVSGESVQFGLLKILEGSKVKISRKSKSGPSAIGFSSSTNGEGPMVTIDTSNILFICSGAFTGMDAIVARRTHSKSLGFAGQVQKSYEADTAGLVQRDALFAQVEPTDLIEFGMIPEFVGRFSTITSTKFLTEDDLMRVLVEPINSPVNQMRALFRLSFPSPIELEFTPDALRAIAKRAIKLGSGARGIRVIVEQLAKPGLFTLAERPKVRHVVIDQQAVKSNGKTCLYLTKAEYQVWRASTIPSDKAATAN